MLTETLSRPALSEIQGAAFGFRYTDPPVLQKRATDERDRDRGWAGDGASRRLAHHKQRASALPKAQHRFVIQVLESVLAQQVR